MMSKINVLPLVLGHLNTLSDFSGHRRWRDYVLFFGLPLAVGVLLVAIGFGFRIDAVNGFLYAFSIFSGLLLNVLVLVFTLASASPSLNVDVRMRKEMLRQIFANICFSVFVSILVVCIAMVALSYMRSNSGATTGRGCTILLASLTINFVLTLLMIIKRMYALLDKELERGSSFSKVA
jgi:hypothetical protein